MSQGFSTFWLRTSLPPHPPPSMSTIWLMPQGMSTFWLRTPPPGGMSTIWLTSARYAIDIRIAFLFLFIFISRSCSNYRYWLKVPWHEQATKYWQHNLGKDFITGKKNQQLKKSKTNKPNTIHFYGISVPSVNLVSTNIFLQIN